MKKSFKWIIAILILCIIVIVLIILKNSFLQKEVVSQEITIGDSISGYRIMNRWHSFSCLTSCNETENNKYEITFIQYYNNNPYEFKYIISKNDYISVYSSKVPNKRTELKLSVNYEKKSIILENEKLIESKIKTEKK